MLFYSVEFIFVFFPICFTLYFISLSIGKVTQSKIILLLSSIAFYAWWHPPNVLILLSSMCFNYMVAANFGHFGVFRHSRGSISNRNLLIFGIFANISLLGYFKYTNFIVGNISSISMTVWVVPNIVLPFAISFFTFQQIAFLVDRYTDGIPQPVPLDYSIFVSFYPQLIAGPIVLAREIFPQLDAIRLKRPDEIYIAAGLSIFTIGVCKKVLIGDTLDPWVSRVFDTAAQYPPTFVEAWTGVLAFTFQIYFDFSGYSDMAVGLGCILGIIIPANFLSPYKATSIIEFWRRWHVTLSRFLRDYLYIPLGGNRGGVARWQMNLMIVMILGGLWHGAGWTFVIWGGLHGFYLIVNHIWRSFRKLIPLRSSTFEKGCAWAITFLAVAIAWSFFRAENFDVAIYMIKGLVGLNGFILPPAYETYFGPLAQFWKTIGFQFIATETAYRFPNEREVAMLLTCLLIVVALPNTWEVFSRYIPINRIDITERVSTATPKPPPNKLIQAFSWTPHRFWAVVMGILLIGASMYQSNYKPFIYFEF